MAKEINPLHVYSSYNCIFTFAVLTKDEINYPDETYANGNAQLEILDPAVKVKVMYQQFLKNK